MYHQIFMCYGFSLKGTIQHIGSIGDTHEAPGRQTLRQGERQRDTASLVGRHGRIAEGGLIKVLAECHLVSICIIRIVAGDILGFNRLGLLCSNHCHLRNGSLIGYCKAYISCCRLSQHDVATSTHHNVTMIIGIDAIVKMAEQQVGHMLIAEGLGTTAAHATPRIPTPRGRGQRQVDRRSKHPLMGRYGIQAMIIENSHQTGIGRRAVRSADGHAPRLLLTRRQAVAERLPRQLQLFVGHRPLDGRLMAIAHTVLHPCEGDEQAIAVGFLIGQLAVNQLPTLLDGTALQLLFTGKDTIDDMEVGVGRAHLYGDGSLVGRELLVRHIEPVVCRCGRALIVQAEHHERHLQGVALADSLKAVLTALQLRIED